MANRAELNGSGGLSRRALWAALAAGVLGAAGIAGAAAYLWPRRVHAPEVDAGAVSDYAVGTVRHFQVQAAGDWTDGSGGPPRNARDFHVVRRPDGFVAFWHRCTHLGCTVPYRPEFEFPFQGRVEKGLFRLPKRARTTLVQLPTGRRTCAADDV